MTALLLTIVLNAALAIAFKIFERFGVDVLQGIVANYWTCVVCGSIAAGAFPISTASIQQPWALPAIGLGALFFALFNLIAWCTLRAGVAATSTANKLSLVIPVAASVLLYREGLNGVKIAGILLAFPAVYLTTRRRDADVSQRASGAVLLAIAAVFIGSGVADTIVKWTETTLLQNPAERPLYLVHLFAAAAVLGAAVLGFRLVRKQARFSSKSLLAGVMLGIPNYFSIHYFIRTLAQKDFLQSSAAIPVVNIGTLLVSTLAAILFFREHLSRSRVLGLALSVAALLLIALSDRHA